MSYKYIAENLQLEEDTVTNYGNVIREEYSKDLLEHGGMLGGVGIRVQVYLFLLLS